ncbi:MAG: hypothetical protein LUB56_02495 [Coprobacillus sp.]|nr:hypothetical protein [Coprobacillus sp.]
MKKTIILAVILAVSCLSACELGDVDDDDKNEEGSGEVSSVTLNGLNSFYMPTDIIEWDNVYLTVTLLGKSTLTLTKGEFDVESPTSDETEFILNTSGLYTNSINENLIPEGDYAISYYFVYNEVEYSGDLFSVAITEYPSTLYSVYYFLDPDFVTTYKANLDRVDDSEDASEDAYYEACEYTVGDDNPFLFKPILALMDHSFTLSIPDSYAVDVSLYLEPDDESDTRANVIDDSEYVSYSNFSFQFTEKAVGHTFTIEMTLRYFSQDINGIPLTPVTFTFNVEDGYNAYKGLDLGRMNIHSEGLYVDDYTYEYHNGAGAHAGDHKVFWDEENEERVNLEYHDLWADFYESIGVSDATYIKGIYMHNDIKLSMDDFPSEYKISESEAATFGYSGDELLIGSLRDETFIYNHLMEDDFTFNGNLFTLDCTDIRWSRTRADGSNYKYFGQNEESTEQGNSRLFTFDGSRRRESKEGVTASIKNLNAVGNLDLEETGDNFPIPEGEAELTTSSLRSGSIWFVDSVGTHTEVDNVIAKEFLLGFYAEKTKSGYLCLEIDHTKLFDCYSAGLFTWCSAENVVRNSTLKRFGAPVVMAMSAIDYTKYGGEETPYIGYLTGFQMSGFTLEESVIIDNYLQGDEYFFQSYGLLEVIPFIKGIDGVFHNGNINSLLDIVLQSLLGDLGGSLSSLFSVTITDYKKTFIVEGEDSGGETTESFNLLYAGMDRNVFGYTTDLYLDFGYAGSNIHIDSDYDKDDPDEANTNNLAYVIDQFYANTDLSLGGFMPLFITNTGKVFTIGLILGGNLTPTLSVYLYDVVAALDDVNDENPSSCSGTYKLITTTVYDFGDHVVHKLEDSYDGTGLSEEDTELMLYYDAGSLMGSGNQNLRIAVGVELFDAVSE